jgi:hypothetical protein
MSMDDREAAFENRFAHDEELRFKVEARRNKLLGIWAAGLLGKSGGEAVAYAMEVVKAEVAGHGGEDVFRKMRADFDTAGIAQSDHQIRRTMAELLDVAVKQVMEE